MGGLDHLVFTGGIGENDARLREEVCGKVGHLGISLDKTLNCQGEARRVVSAANSPVKIHVIPADEEWVVARKTYEYSDLKF